MDFLYIYSIHAWQEIRSKLYTITPSIDFQAQLSVAGEVKCFLEILVTSMKQV